jgi:hypothetical protein
MTRSSPKRITNVKVKAKIKPENRWSIFERTLDARLYENRFLIQVALFIFMAIHLTFSVNLGWSLDSGMIAHLGERTLNGEWPHIDYDDSYTGLSDFYHALILKFLGIKLISLRYALYAFCLVVIAVYLNICFRVKDLLLAIVFSLLGYFFTFPTCYESMPTYHVMGLGIFNLAILLQYQKNRKFHMFILEGI